MYALPPDITSLKMILLFMSKLNKILRSKPYSDYICNNFRKPDFNGFYQMLFTVSEKKYTIFTRFTTKLSNFVRKRCGS